MPPVRPNPQVIADLRKVRHKYAPAVARTARMIETLAKRLVKLQREAVKEAKAVAGNNSHMVGFDEHGSIETQNNRSVPVIGPGFVDIMDTARATADNAELVAKETTPPPLPSE